LAVKRGDSKLKGGSYKNRIAARPGQEEAGRRAPVRFLFFGSAFGRKFGQVGYGFPRVPRKYNLPALPLSSGSRLGPYEIVAPLGAGGMGEVYRARDTRLGREVAVKVVAQHLAGEPDLKARFERKARAVAALNHPNILAIHDVGEEGGILFAVTELLPRKPSRLTPTQSEKTP
jgi:serine/threonine protein kinase